MKDASKSKAQPPRSLAEWVSLGMSLLVLAAIIGLILVIWQSPSDEQPRFVVEQATIQEQDGVFYLPVTIQNDGATTVSQVRVEGRLEGENEPEVVETTFDQVPGHSSVEAVLIFSQDPSAAQVRVVSYQLP